MENIKNEKFIVRVIRRRTIETPAHKDSTSQIPKVEERSDPIYEQEFDKFDIADFATKLNRKEKDEKSLKMSDEKVDEILDKEIKEDDYQMTEKGHEPGK